MRFIILAFVLSTLGGSKILAQSESVSGIVLDESGDPIPFAHVRIGDSYAGTLTNIHGNFQLNVANRASTELVISCVGYVSKSIMASKSGSMRITLKEDLIRLQEVTIVPKNYAMELVASAIDSIPVNYPTREELITGFIRETLSRDSLADDLHYISEAQTEASKSSYEKATSKDEVKLVKGRKLDIDTDNLGIRIYAGVHLPHRFDLVMSREGPLNPKKLDNYIYEIDDTVRYDGKSIFQVGYLSRNGHEYGTISIVDGTHAILSIEQFQTKDKFKGGNVLSANERQYLKSVTNYDIHDDSLWRLNYIQYNTMFINGKATTYLNSLYTTHGFREEKEKILYVDRIQFGDFLTEEVDEFDPNYWTDYNVTLPDQKFDEAYQEKPEESEEVKAEPIITIPTFLKIVSRMEFSYGVRAIQTNSFAHNLRYSQGEIDIDRSLNDGTETQWLLTSTMSYKLTERSLISFESSRSLGKDKASERYLGYTYRIPIGKGMRTFLAGSIGYNYTEYNRSLGQITLVNNTKIDGKKIDAEEVDIYSSTNAHSIMTSLSFIYEKSRRFKFVFGVDYFSPLGGNNGIRFIEDQGIFRRKDVFLKDGEEGVAIDSSESLNFERDLGFRAGILIAF